jgi:hypothetical protein
MTLSMLTFICKCVGDWLNQLLNWVEKQNSEQDKPVQPDQDVHVHQTTWTGMKNNWNMDYCAGCGSYRLHQEDDNA